MPDVRRAYDVYEAYEAYEAYEVWKGIFLTPSAAGNSFHRLRAVPLPRRGRSWGLRRSRPAALPSIAYRGFAVAPMTLRAPSRNLVYNSGCRVATLLVSKGVMGFLGDLRGRNSKSPPNPLGLAERVHRRSGGRSYQTVEGVHAGGERRYSPRSSLSRSSSIGAGSGREK